MENLMSMFIMMSENKKLEFNICTYYFLFCLSMALMT